MLMDLMKKNNFSAVWVAIILMVFSTACTKPLMPPDIEASGGVSESGFEDSGFGDEQANSDFDPTFTEDPIIEGFAADDANQGEPGLLMEEDLADLEYAAGDNDLDLKAYQGDIPGNGSSGSYGVGGSTGTGGSIADSGSASSSGPSAFAKGVPPQVVDKEADEARLFSYRPTAKLKDVHFRFDRFDLDEQSKGVLSENASFLKDNPKVRVEIQGHCDERGTNNYNLALGQRRANSTKRFLKTLGIPETRMHVISYGEEKPFCVESNESCWWRNRRAHFLVAR
jgi:peptidoglycan-associated lipoprotein